MKWAFPLARIAGVRIYVHSVFLLLIVFALWPVGTPDLDMTINVAVVLVLLLVCVLLHELGHTVVAHRYGLSVQKIMLWPFGGAMLLDRPPDTPKHDLLIALAGPLMNIAVGGVAFVLLIVHAGITGETIRLDYGQLAELSFTSVMAWLCLINGLMALINLIPADPFDGAYIFRRVLLMLTSPARAATLTRILGWGGVVIIGGIGLVLMEAFFITTSLLIGIALIQKRFAHRPQEVLQTSSADRYKTVPLDPAQLDAVLPPSQVATSPIEKQITLLAVLHFILAGIALAGAILSCLVLVYEVLQPNTLPSGLFVDWSAVLVSASVLSALAFVVVLLAGIGLLHHRVWGYYLYLVVALGIALTIVGILYAIPAFIYGLKPAFRARFFPNSDNHSLFETYKGKG